MLADAYLETNFGGYVYDADNNVWKMQRRWQFWEIPKQLHLWQAAKRSSSTSSEDCETSTTGTSGKYRKFGESGGETILIANHFPENHGTGEGLDVSLEGNSHPREVANKYLSLELNCEAEQASEEDFEQDTNDQEDDDCEESESHANDQNKGIKSSSEHYNAQSLGEECDEDIPSHNSDDASRSGNEKKYVSSPNAKSKTERIMSTGPATHKQLSGSFRGGCSNAKATAERPNGK